jgi:cell division protein FtsW (lipid II flippase)
MARTLKSDRPLFVLTMLLVGCGLVMVYSASYPQATNRNLSPYYFLFRQLTWAVIGFTALWCAMRVDYRVYRRPAAVWSLLALSVALLFAVLLVGPSINHTRRWFQLGYMSFQPSELAKLSAVVLTAALLEQRMHRMRDVAEPSRRGAVLVVVLSGGPGTAAVIVGAVLTMLLAAGISYRHLVSRSVPSRGRRPLIWDEPHAKRPDLCRSRLYASDGGIRSAVDDGHRVGRAVRQGFTAAARSCYPRTAHRLHLRGPAEEFGLSAPRASSPRSRDRVADSHRAARTRRFGSLLALGITMIIAIQVSSTSAWRRRRCPKALLPFISNGVPAAPSMIGWASC